MFLAEKGNENYAAEVKKKWADTMKVEGLPDITDPYKRDVTLRLLENQETFLAEAPPANNIGNNPSASSNKINTWDPILISMIRRATPNLIPFDIMGVQPMTGPVGLIFSMRSKYVSQTGVEAMFNEPQGTFSGTDANPAAGDTGSWTMVLNVTTAFINTEIITGATSGAVGVIDQATGLGAGIQTIKVIPQDSGTDPNLVWQIGETVDGNDATPGKATVLGFHSNGMTTASAETLGDPATNAFNEMAFTIDRTSVEAKTRALKAEYSLELSQDLKAVHGLDAETELSNILSTEITAEINREMVNTLYFSAKVGAQVDVATAGTFDLDTDSNGRWSVERFKGLMFQIERDANVIARETRRGRGNIIVCSSDVASALSMAGKLDTSPALNNNLNVDDTGNTFAGVLNGKYKLFIDPYWVNTNEEFYMVGYKGSTFADQGAFYAPYVPLEMVRATDENTFQPKIAFKTRYGVVSNPFVNTSGAINSRENQYYRRVTVKNVM